MPGLSIAEPVDSEPSFVIPSDDALLALSVAEPVDSEPSSVELSDEKKDFSIS